MKNTIAGDYPEDKYPNQYPYPPSKKDSWNPHRPWNEPVPNKMVAPKVVTVSDLFPRLDRLSIGWSPLLEQLKEITNEKPSYPPYDLIKFSDTQNILEVAVAGFSKSDITITVQEAVLTITGKKDTQRAGEVLHKGIASRDFELKLALAEYWEVMSAHVNDGLLTLILGKVLPEEKKPKVIDIQ